MRSPRRPTLAALALASLFLGAAGSVHAQQQERGMMDRIQHPDMSLAFHPADKRFGGSQGPAGLDRRAMVRPFLFGRSATVKSYRPKDFAGSRGFTPTTFAGRDRAAAVNNPAAGANRAFATRDVAVSEARDARKGLLVRSARIPTFTPVGKRQGALDEQQRTRPMTIDEVRELLNKSR